MKKQLFRIYCFFVLRHEKMKAVRMWKKGVKACDKRYKEVGGPRFYLFFDYNRKDWVPMTLEPNIMNYPAYRTLKIMGKIRSRRLCSQPEDMKNSCYYYTPSKHGAKGLITPEEKAEKLQQWIDYYLLRISIPMLKIRRYKKKHQITS
ncbi:MAG: hypothetical protein IJ698_00330 [Prevotella sp.]|nr:hypothetical protein [Prevotella sp.]